MQIIDTISVGYGKQDNNALAIASYPQPYTDFHFNEILFWLSCCASRSLLMHKSKTERIRWRWFQNTKIECRYAFESMIYFYSCSLTKLIKIYIYIFVFLFLSNDFAPWFFFWLLFADFTHAPYNCWPNNYEFTVLGLTVDRAILYIFLHNYQVMFKF